jgi:hypothetical protein
MCEVPTFDQVLWDPEVQDGVGTIPFVFGGVGGDHDLGDSVSAECGDGLDIPRYRWQIVHRL